MSNKPSPGDIENLIELFNQSDWEEMHLKTETFEIYLSSDPAAQPPGEAGAAAPTQIASPVPAAAPAAVAEPSSESASGSTAEQPVAEGMVAVRAPNLGTFYRAPKPGAPAYVEVGQSVSADSEVCLIEVMKLFTPVKAGVSGTVREIRVSDAEMVEFEQVLVVIEPEA